jgi:hypothetical protein
VRVVEVKKDLDPPETEKVIEALHKIMKAL